MVPSCSTFRLSRCPERFALSPRRLAGFSPGEPRQQARSQCGSCPAGINVNRDVDVVALGNLCVDIMMSVPELPVEDPRSNTKLIDELLRSCASEGSWEVGGSSNFLIAAARLGMRALSAGHVVPDAYGKFLLGVLKDEGVLEPVVSMASAEAIGKPNAHPLLTATLLCFVLVDPQSRHAFCSQYDAVPGPIFGDDDTIPTDVFHALSRSRACYLNGFLFDEMSPGLIERLAVATKDLGTALLFDPGPKSMQIMGGTAPGKEVMQDLIRMSEVVLLTQEEAAAFSGREDPRRSSEWVLSRPGSETKWCFVKMGKRGAMLHAQHSSGPLVTSGFEVKVSDTVGCGDSFAAAAALGFIESYDLEGVLQLANAVGAATAMGRGAGRNVANAQEVLRMLEAVQSRNGTGSEDRPGVDSALKLLRTSLRGKALHMTITQ